MFLFDEVAMSTKIQRALISVSDKSGLIPFVQQLSEAGVEIISTVALLERSGKPASRLSN